MMGGFLGKIVIRILSYLGRESASYILSMQAGAIKESCKNEGFVFTYDHAEIENSISSLRVEKKNLYEWVAHGSGLCVALVESKKGMPRGWIHFRGVRNVSLFDCTIGKKAAWLGPDFIPLEHRGKKLHSCLIAQRSLEAFKNHDVEVLFTGINVSNVASLRNYMKNGFQIVGLLRSRRFLFVTIKTRLVYSDVVTDNLMIK